MAHYNKLSEVVYNEKLRSWRFRVKILRVYPFYSFMSNEAHMIYVLVDEDGTKMEMTIYSHYAERCRGLEKKEGEWVEIFRVEVCSAYPGFRATKSPFSLTATGHTQVHIINPLNNRLYMDFKNIHKIHRISNCRDRDYPIDTMGLVFKTEAHFNVTKMPKMVFYLRDNIESQIKCVATGDHAYAFRDGFEEMRGRGEVIVVLKMWRIWKFYSFFGPPDLWLKTEGGLSDFRFNLRLPEVEEFRQSLLRSDPYVQKHGAIGPL